MTWKMIGKPTTKKLTRPLAKQFAEMTPAKNDRHQKQRIMQFLRSVFDEGRFTTCQWACAICKEDGEVYRVNGKHTSTMFNGMNGEFPDDVYVTVSEYECETLQDVAALYSTFDNRQSSRTSSDINRIFVGTDADLSDLPERLVGWAIAGMGYCLLGEDCYASKSTAEQRAALALQHKEFVLWFCELVKSSVDSRHLRRASVAAAMYQTHRKSKAAASEFWLAVRDGTGPSPKSPDRVLQKFLLTTSVNSGSGARIGSRPVAPREMYVKCLHAWNAWRRNQPTDLKYFATAKTPVCA